MKRWPCVALFALASAAACGPTGPASERTGVAGSAIEDGTVDAKHTFAVGVVQLSKLQSGEVAFCSGVVLGPNLVATARHCVSQLSSTAISCNTSTFGAVVPVADVLVTTDTTISPRGNLIGVSSIIVPSAANESKVCGNDLALLILNGTIQLPQYVTPVIDPPMTDHAEYATRVTAIGYGVSTPTDEAGVTAGERRIKEDVNLLCIPGDTTFVDCFSDPLASQVLAKSEFISGDASTCEGDSGSGAYDQAMFDQGRWFAFGVLSRGAVSADGGTCVEPIYERFDSWGSLLANTAKQAASVGHYTAPAWATGPDAAATPDSSMTSLDRDSGGPPEEFVGSSTGGGCTAAASKALGSGPPAVFALGLLGLVAARGRRKR